MRARWSGLALLVCGAACRPDRAVPAEAPCASAAAIDALRINQLQVVGSHNSYRRHTYGPMFNYVQTMAPLAAEIEPQARDYDNPPPADRLVRHHVHAREIDLSADPQGGRFFNRQGLRLLGEP